MTGAGNLRANFVIHAVGPIWRGGGGGEERLLANTYGSCLKLTEGAGIGSISFPSISTGAYSFPLPRAAEIALRTVLEHLRTGKPRLKLVRFVLFDGAAMDAFSRALKGLAAEFANPATT